jgi:hypothetical protein
LLQVSYASQVKVDQTQHNVWLVTLTSSDWLDTRIPVTLNQYIKVDFRSITSTVHFKIGDFLYTTTPEDRTISVKCYEDPTFGNHCNDRIVSGGAAWLETIKLQAIVRNAPLMLRISIVDRDDMYVLDRLHAEVGAMHNEKHAESKALAEHMKAELAKKH